MGKLIERLQERFGDGILEAEERRGEETIVVPREDMLGIFRTLRDDGEFQFGFLMDYTAVDYVGRTPRFDLVAHLFSLSRLHRLRVKARVDESDCRAPSLTPVWKAADWLEREIWDMFGIRFDDHPDLRRILMYPEFEGHPLRKDYPVLKRQPIIPERDPVENPWPSRSTRLRG